MNNITIELCQEDRARIDILNKALGLLTAQLEGINAAAEAKGLIEDKVVETDIILSKALTTPDTTPELPQETPEPVEQEQTPPETENAQDEPTVTKQDIQQKVIELVGKGKKAEARDVITTYADSVTGLPEDALAEVWDKLTALNK